MVLIRRGFLVMAMRIAMVMMMTVVTRVLLMRGMVNVTVQRTETPAGDNKDRTDQQ